MLIHRVKVEVQVSAWQQWESTYEHIITRGEYIRTYNNTGRVHMNIQSQWESTFKHSTTVGEYIRTNTQSHMESTYKHSVTVGEYIRTFSGRGEYIRTFHHNKGGEVVAGAPKASHIIITHKHTLAPFQSLC